MIRIISLLLLGLLLFSPSVHAQAPVAPCVTSTSTVLGLNTYNCIPVTAANPLPVTDSGGSAPIPYQPSPVAGTNTDQHNLGIVTATALTIPIGALFAEVCASGNNVKFRWDGTAPTATVGMPLLTGQCQAFAGATLLAALQFIQTAATATLDVAYSK